jgi:hypothetical protein
MKPNKQPVYTGAGARRSRLLAQDRRADPLSAMSACGTKQTFNCRLAMSAFGGKADISSDLYDGPAACGIIYQW